MAMVGVLMAYETPNSTGTVHAVPLGDDLSFCGPQMLSYAGRPWPMARRLWPLDMSPCAECSRQVYEQPSLAGMRQRPSPPQYLTLSEVAEELGSS